MKSTHYCPRSMFGLEYVEKDGIWYFFDYEDTWLTSTTYSANGGDGLLPVEQKPGGRKMLEPCDNFEVE